MFSLVYRATYHYIIIPSAYYNLNVLIETKSLPKIVQGSLKILLRSFARFYSRITGIEILILLMFFRIANIIIKIVEYFKLTNVVKGPLPFMELREWSSKIGIEELVIAHQHSVISFRLPTLVM